MRVARIAACARIAECVLASLIIAKFADAQPIQQAPGTGSLPNIGYEFDQALRSAGYLQETPPDPAAHDPTDPMGDGPLADAADPMGNETDPMGGDADPLATESSSDAVTCCPRCHCICCMCPEPAHPCDECPRVNNLNPAWGVTIGGTISLDALYNSARPVAPGTPFFLAPEAQPGFEEDTYDIHARETSIFMALNGPKIGCYESGGLIMFALYNDSITVDRYGFLPYQAWGELKNEYWRFAGGLQMDIFAPLLPTVLPFSFLAASGNAGLYRGQLARAILSSWK